ncbi:MAG: hypothetical protein IIC22_03260, partial [Chloroflexi bacterium]|nr:hypothetical protein [Chloroflexota bacterium]
MSSGDLHFRSIAELSDMIRQKEISPVELTMAYLERIDALNERLGAFITVMREHALSQARQAERSIQAGDYLGPLHGIPVAIKD